MAVIDDRWTVERDGQRVPTDRFGSGKRWRVRYRTPNGQQRNRAFDRKVDAQRFSTTVEAAKLNGSYIAPEAGRLTIRDWAQRWIEGQSHLKPSTAERYRGILREHIQPKWGDVQLSNVSHADVQGWVRTLADHRSPATVRKIHRVLSLVLDLAVKDGRLVRNPAAGVSLPRVADGERRYLTHLQVEQLAAHVAQPYTGTSRVSDADREAAHVYRLVVLFLAYTGCRFGEMAALRVRSLDVARRRALISESVTVIKGVQTWGTPKGHARREVPIPRFLVEELSRHVAGRAPEDLVFNGVKGGALRSQVFQRAALSDAARVIGVEGLHPHELRHTAASLAIASGANVKVVQQMLGHKSATMTLDLYGHLFEDQLDEVADALDLARTAAGVSQVCPTRDLRRIGLSSQ